MSKMEVVTRAFGKGVTFVQKNAPEILTSMGIISGIAAAVMGAKATLRVEEEVLEPFEEGMETVKSLVEAEKYGGSHEIARDKAYIYTKAALNFVKVYGPAVAMGVNAIGCIIGAHGIMKKRNATLLAAYNAIDLAFRNYRNRVIEEHGEEVDRRYISGRYEVENEETGETEEIVYEGQVDLYTRVFDENNKERWQRNPEYNRMFLKSREVMWNQKLQAHGHIFLNEVLRDLGYEHTPNGALVGWVYEGGSGDGYIDFGLNTEHNKQALSSHSRTGDHTVYLEFNVDGAIINEL